MSRRRGLRADRWALRRAARPSRLEAAWVPDGTGLPLEAAALVAEHGSTVHLRLHDRNDPQRYPRSGCGEASLGGWWTGAPSEVTCPACAAAWRPTAPTADHTTQNGA